jgi:uncharacterized protein
LKALKPFEIAFVGLSNGLHEFTFELNDAFFSCFADSEVSKADLTATLVMHKKNNMLDLEFLVKGKLELTCDRCLENYWYQMDLQKMLYIKFGERFEEQSDDVIIIPSTESHIDVAQYFFEFVVLGLPAKRVHQGGKNKEDNCDADVIEQLEKYSTDNKNKAKENKQDNSPVDSRWDALKNLKFN